MKKTINLFNHYHNGDVFYSRMILQPLLNYFDINFYHSNRIGLFEDIKQVKEFNFNNDFYPDQHYSDPSLGIVNTWIGQQNHKYIIPDHTCDFKNNFKIVDEVLNILNINIPEEHDILPSVNYENLKNYENVKSSLELIKNKFKKIILICNGAVHSGQSGNFSFNQIIDNLSGQYPEICFITTEDTSIIKENIFYTYEITQKIPDLLLISFISKYCDIIVGRQSGPQCFCHTKENLLDNKKIFITINDNELGGKWYYNSVAEQIWSNNYDTQYIENLIKSKL